MVPPGECSIKARADWGRIIAERDSPNSAVGRTVGLGGGSGVGAGHLGFDGFDEDLARKACIWGTTDGR